jgi:transcriptional regulator with XRE-family HTH domain
MNRDMTVGQRIRYYRKRRGLSQVVLAGLVGKSTSWLTKVERGERTIDKVSVLQQLANVLKVGLGDLIGGVELPPNGGEPLDPPRGVHAIRRAIFVPGIPDREPLDAPALRAAVERVAVLHGDGFYEQVAKELPALLEDCRIAVAHEVPGASWCLALALQDAAGLGCTLEELDLASAAALMAIDAAQQSDDPIMVARSQQKLAAALIYHGWFDDAGAVCSNAADTLAPTDATSRAAWSMWGSLHFNLATAAVRSSDTAAAWQFLRASRSAIPRVGEGHNDYWEAFGPGSVGANEVMVALETGNPVEALRIADHVDFDEMPNKWRRSRHLLDVAQAWGQRADDAAAVVALVRAEEHAPDVVRYSVKAREVIHALLRRERKSRTPQLRGLAERMGVAA